jgi:hypothetical protein
MLLAASIKTPATDTTPAVDLVEAIDVGDIPTGTRVTLEGEDSPPAPTEIDIDTFFSVPIKVTDHIVNTGGKRLLLNGAPIKTQKLAEGDVG